jgi:hypothetical protein
MPRRLPPHLHRERTRHGVFIWYVRIYHHGPRIRIREEYKTRRNFGRLTGQRLKGNPYRKKPEQKPERLLG